LEEKFKLGIGNLSSIDGIETRIEFELAHCCSLLARHFLLTAADPNTEATTTAMILSLPLPRLLLI